MWYLEGLTGGRYYLTPNKTLRFGRKIGDILLVNDASISRLHASIFASLITNDEEISTCNIKDLKSKYGTWVERGDLRVKVTSDGYNLRDQDEIQFGVQDQIYKVVYVPIVVVTSLLDASQKTELQSIMDEIGGFYSENWTQQCTHLTVSRATLTEKVTCAMAAAVPIITMSYWKSVQVAVKNGSPLPDTKEFISLIGESFMGKLKASFDPNEKRKTLFRNMVFIHFSSDQYEMYGSIIRLAGGKPVLYNSRRVTSKYICAPNVIVLQHPDGSMSQSTLGITNDYDIIYKILEKNKRKMIPETDIPLAIWYCSIEKYCNPTFSFATFLKREQSSLPAAEVLVLDTQDVASTRSLPQIVSDLPVTSNISLKNATTGHLIIPETCDEFSTQRTSTIDCVNDSEAVAEINEPRIIRETADTFADTSLTQGTQQIPEVSGTRENAYIPETNDSSFSIEIDENAVHLKDDIENSLKQDHEMQVSTKDQEIVQTIVKEELNESGTQQIPEVSGTRENAYIPETNDSSFSIEIDENAVHLKDDIENSLTQDHEMQVSTKDQEIVQTIVKEELNESITENKAKSGNNIDLNINWDLEADQNCNNSVGCISLKKEETKSPVKLNTKIVQKCKENCSPIPQGTKGSHKRTMKTAEWSSENDSDEECLPFAKKAISLENSGLSVEGYEIADNSERETSFLRNNSKSKKFSKVHKKIPTSRIALDNMYVWDLGSSTK